MISRRNLLALIFVAGCFGCGPADPSTPLPSERMDALLDDPSRASTEELLAACLTASAEKDWEKAAFFVWCAQVRRQVERAVFPPTESGGDDPLLPSAAISQMYAGLVLPRLYCLPEAHEAAIGRLQAYRPTIGRFYRPFWKTTRGMSRAEAHQKAEDLVSALAEREEKILDLTADPDYLAALRVYVDWEDESAERGSRLLTAIETMRSIEEQAGFKSGLVPEGRAQPARSDNGG